VTRYLLISGASRGIGEALAEHYLARGDVVVGCARGPAAIEHENYHHVRADVCRDEDVANLFRVVRSKVPRLDGLINNAGAARMLPIALTPPETAEAVMNVNFMGTFRLTHAAVRLLRTSAAPRIVNLSSVAAAWRLEGEAVYAAAKAAVEMLTRVTAKEFGQWGITCNAVGPTPIRTDLLRKVPEDKLEALVRRQSIPRWAEIRDVIHVVDFFMHPSSRLITGQVVYLGGAG
jgi:3-oxoacyl-[acyl-carrier protein] reductase